jgi:hypothetical protein
LLSKKRNLLAGNLGLPPDPTGVVERAAVAEVPAAEEVTIVVWKEVVAVVTLGPTGATGRPYTTVLSARARKLEKALVSCYLNILLTH